MLYEDINEYYSKFIEPLHDMISNQMKSGEPLDKDRAEVFLKRKYQAELALKVYPGVVTLMDASQDMVNFIDEAIGGDLSLLEHEDFKEAFFKKLEKLRCFKHEKQGTMLDFLA